MKYTTASDVAKYFICSFQKKNKEISNLKLQKLLYYAQAWHLVFFDVPLFDDKIEAWVHGPVVRSVFQEYRKFGWKPLSVPAPVQDAGSIIFPKSVKNHLGEVLRVYGKFDAVTLERMTHREDPWREARGNLAPDAPSKNVISDIAMKRYYGARLGE